MLSPVSASSQTALQERTQTQHRRQRPKLSCRYADKTPSPPDTCDTSSRRSPRQSRTSSRASRTSRATATATATNQSRSRTTKETSNKPTKQAKHEAKQEDILQLQLATEATDATEAREVDEARNEVGEGARDRVAQTENMVVGQAAAPDAVSAVKSDGEVEQGTAEGG